MTIAISAKFGVYRLRITATNPLDKIAFDYAIDIGLEPYEKNYIDLLNNNYKSLKLFNDISLTDKELLLEFAFYHNFYVKSYNYNEDDNKNYSNNDNSSNDEPIKYDSINITYKKYLPQNIPYPITICEFLNNYSNFEKIKQYGHYKFQTLEKYISLMCKSNN